MNQIRSVMKAFSFKGLKKSHGIMLLMA